MKKYVQQTMDAVQKYIDEVYCQIGYCDSA